MRGFTLLEVLAAFSIFLVLLGLSAVSLLNSSDKYRLQKAVWEIHSKLNYARFKAVFSGTKYRISFNQAGFSLEKYNLDSEEWEVEMGTILEGVLVQANNNPVFYPQGTVSNLASILVTNTWGGYKITLAISGRIRIIHL